MNSPHAIRSVLITGAKGNLGRKLIAHLLASEWCHRVIAVDCAVEPSPDSGDMDRVDWVEGNLADPADRRWRRVLAGVDAVVHLAAQNPYPDAPWSDACASFDMTLHVVEAAAATGVQRLVFASSNHVMGQYKDPPLADTLLPGGLSTLLPPGPGTRWFNGKEMVQGFAYAASKLMGERICMAKAHLSGSAFTTVSVRIGWCQPGDNRPETINTSGLPGGEPGIGPDAERDLRWFRNMWLSNRDFLGLIERALLADSSGWPAPGIVVNGMSANRGMPWDIGMTRRMIGYEPQDDVWEHVI
jgi:nucleoside-diphosphate-sugar epimerase